MIRKIKKMVFVKIVKNCHKCQIASNASDATWWRNGQLLGYLELRISCLGLWGGLKWYSNINITQKYVYPVQLVQWSVLPHSNEQSEACFDILPHTTALQCNCNKTLIYLFFCIFFTISLLQSNCNKTLINFSLTFFSSISLRSRCF